VTLENRLEARQHRKLLAIDGGGIRGVLALEILGKVEAELRDKMGNKDLRLADYFDFIGGTSTGAIVAAGLAKGMQVQEILDFYIRCGADMFTRAIFLKRSCRRWPPGMRTTLLRPSTGYGRTASPRSAPICANGCVGPVRTTRATCLATST
jgi:predicted acylesterase/phospholipase RssA